MPERGILNLYGNRENTSRGDFQFANDQSFCQNLMFWYKIVFRWKLSLSSARSLRAPSVCPSSRSSTDSLMMRPSSNCVLWQVFLLPSATSSSPQLLNSSLILIIGNRVLGYCSYLQLIIHEVFTFDYYGVDAFSAEGLCPLSTTSLCVFGSLCWESEANPHHAPKWLLG